MAHSFANYTTMSGGGSGEPDVAAAAAGVKEMAIGNGASQNQAPASDEKDWAKVVAEKKPYYEKRVDMFAAIKAKQEAGLEAAKAANIPIKIVLPDGTEKPGIKNVTNPMDVANSISKSLAKKTIVAKVDGKVWDLLRPLEGDCSLELCSFEDPDGKEVRIENETQLLHCLERIYLLPFSGSITFTATILHRSNLPLFKIYYFISLFADFLAF
jgi:TGS domain